MTIHNILLIPSECSPGHIVELSKADRTRHAALVYENAATSQHRLFSSFRFTDASCLTCVKWYSRKLSFDQQSVINHLFDAVQFRSFQQSLPHKEAKVARNGGRAGKFRQYQESNAAKFTFGTADNRSGWVIERAEGKVDFDVIARSKYLWPRALAFRQLSTHYIHIYPITESFLATEYTSDGLATPLPSKPSLARPSLYLLGKPDYPSQWLWERGRRPKQ